MTFRKGKAHKASTNIAPAGMFIFSKPMASSKSLEAWHGYFLSKGINSVIISDEYGRYYLCREGIEATGEDWFNQNAMRRSYRRRF